MAIARREPLMPMLEARGAITGGGTVAGSSQVVSGCTGALPAAPVFSAGTRTAGDVAYVSFRGELDLAGCEEASEALLEAEQQEPRTMIIDCSELAFMDGQGLRLMFRARDWASRRNRGLLILRPGRPVKRVFEIAGLDGSFEFLDDRNG
jgi:anti-sigma B factor antagonist